MHKQKTPTTRWSSRRATLDSILWVKVFVFVWLVFTVFENCKSLTQRGELREAQSKKRPETFANGASPALHPLPTAWQAKTPRDKRSSPGSPFYRHIGKGRMGSGRPPPPRTASAHLAVNLSQQRLTRPRGSGPQPAPAAPPGGAQASARRPSPLSFAPLRQPTRP